MGREKGPLTEPMYYVLMSFLRQDMCGTEITEFVDRKTRGRVNLGPGTLYTLLARFLDEGLIRETQVDGRRRTYRITPKGRAAFQEELDRLRACAADGEGCPRHPLRGLRHSWPGGLAGPAGREGPTLRHHPRPPRLL